MEALSFFQAQVEAFVSKTNKSFKGAIAAAGLPP